MNWIDLKLGFRMLVKYPGLTCIGGLAMAFAIFAGVIGFGMVTALMYPSLPLQDGDRIVEIRARDVEKSTGESRLLFDFRVWQRSVKSVTDLGAWLNSNRNLVIAGRETMPVPVAEMSASGFRVGQGEPLMGRVLSDADAEPAAPLVTVLGYEIWQSRFGGDNGIIGKTVQLGDEYAVVVGVMREGFEFPVSHDVWLPLRTAGPEPAPRAGPGIAVFGRLAPGATLETAQAELTTIGRSLAADFPATHQHVQPEVRRYADMFAMDDEFGILFAVNAFLFMLLTLICGNVGLLVFARAATRESDLVVRTALGASRGRIVWQLFAETLVLGGIAAAIGLALGAFALQRYGIPFLEANVGRLPFWTDLHLAPRTMAYAMGLAVFGSAVAGVIPAFKLTRGMSDRLKQATSGGGGLQFGGVWTVVIVAQVAVTTMFPAALYWEQFQVSHMENFDPGFAAGEYLTARINMDPGTPAVRFTQTIRTLRERVAATPGVAGVTLTHSLPATSHPTYRIQLASDSGAEVFDYADLAVVEPSYFDVLQSPPIAGRTFTDADRLSGSLVAIVDQGFVDLVLEGRNPIGQRVRFAPQEPKEGAPAEPWFEVVGLVKELGIAAPYQRGRQPGLYLPGPSDRFSSVYVMVHTRSADPAAFGPKLREIATAVDPTVRLSEIVPANQVNNDLVWVMGLWLRITGVVSAVALTLSLAGIYAVLAFTVSRRTREIGVRVALGGSRERVLAAIFRRPLIRVGAGVFIGAALVLTLGILTRGTEFPGSDAPVEFRHIALLGGYVALILGVCLLACIVPARRALRVQPTVALRSE